MYIHTVESASKPAKTRVQGRDYANAGVHRKPFCLPGQTYSISKRIYGKSFRRAVCRAMVNPVRNVCAVQGPRASARRWWRAATVATMATGHRNRFSEYCTFKSETRENTAVANGDDLHSYKYRHQDCVSFQPRFFLLPSFFSCKLRTHRYQPRRFLP